jgi:hypothetical protein
MVRLAGRLDGAIEVVEYSDVVLIRRFKQGPDDNVLSKELFEPFAGAYAQFACRSCA